MQGPDQVGDNPTLSAAQRSRGRDLCDVPCLSLNVTELADRFSVSVVTIRKDLDDLESEDLLQRTFGGAVFSHRSRFNGSFLELAQEHRRAKCAIAAAAHSYIKDGDAIMLDAGTTTLALAEHLKTHVKSVFIITHSVRAALELSSAGYDILLLGGTVRNKSLIDLD